MDLPNLGSASTQAGQAKPSNSGSGCPRTSKVELQDSAAGSGMTPTSHANKASSLRGR